MFGLQRNAVIGLNLYCGGAGLGAGSGGATPPGGRLLATEKEASTQREVGGGEAGAVIGGSAGASPPAALTPDARRVVRPPPIGAEVPDVTATPSRLLFFAPTRRAAPLEEMEAPAADAIMSPEEELDGYEPEPLGKRPAVLPLLELVGEPGNGSSTDGSLPSTPPPAEEEEDELYRQSLEIISRSFGSRRPAPRTQSQWAGPGPPAGRRWRPYDGLGTACSATTRQPSKVRGLVIARLTPFFPIAPWTNQSVLKRV
ncbi:DNA polymerase alpha accessory factor Mcl1 [Saguinus oedipus]|uniref:DNA polymerase alpha accessory factor Mcl1 n=1 Tax=Saguinus oedipus TaxID=9490 RepID=A0ABQ9THL9_SAGOE|nr:DNA polymerase alpha accessory factor Mcl1 [Saguinus oedipus]